MADRDLTEADAIEAGLWIGGRRVSARSGELAGTT
jgi:hypothetical protein